MFNEYPILFVDVQTGETLDFDTRPFGSTLNLSKGMEITFNDNRRWEITRIFVTQISDTQPCLFVGLHLSQLKSFVTLDHVKSIESIYKHLANEALQEESESSEKGEESLMAYPWKSFQNPN